MRVIRKSNLLIFIVSSIIFLLAHIEICPLLLFHRDSFINVFTNFPVRTFSPGFLCIFLLDDWFFRVFLVSSLEFVKLADILSDRCPISSVRNINKIFSFSRIICLINHTCEIFDISTEKNKTIQNQAKQHWRKTSTLKHTHAHIVLVHRRKLYVS